jgi:hypothetical protein
MKRKVVLLTAAELLMPMAPLIDRKQVRRGPEHRVQLCNCERGVCEHLNDPTIRCMQEGQ